ncbi:hypothetical protein [Corynebacterium sp. Marseille-P4321]|uniref:hypothetical protein n=1 Tax=Corynebacterium sp. Marseille-P4321 TaxID=2736603 RepID=UPI000892B57A|nr:hypothetical protein [Corynebacterium sp. Marseille-P4321]OEY23586.1 hypothetical protein A0K93_03395 [Corynebacterium sp. BCW_4722]
MIASRKAVAGIAAVAAIALAGCTPPNENPSTEKVDTATTQDPNSLKGAGSATASATNVTEADELSQDTGEAVVAEDGTPMLNNCGVTGLVRPERLTVDCKKQDDFLEDIVWDSWDDNLATGTATRVVLDPDNREEGVQVVLGSPQIVNDELVFTTMSVDGAPVNPENDY